MNTAVWCGGPRGLSKERPRHVHAPIPKITVSENLTVGEESMRHLLRVQQRPLQHSHFVFSLKNAFSGRS